MEKLQLAIQSCGSFALILEKNNFSLGYGVKKVRAIGSPMCKNKMAWSPLPDFESVKVWRGVIFCTSMTLLPIPVIVQKAMVPSYFLGSKNRRQYGVVRKYT
ncbi:MAG: hypothetical protein BGP19_16320 [Thiobacillus sp. 0-1251]|nr:MAG: hypothetical protein BGP19_16320 [Thiobacillus sp. 0-1251]